MSAIEGGTGPVRLVVDIGNTETVLGLARDGGDIVAHWRLSTQAPRTVDEYHHLLRGLLSGGGAPSPKPAEAASRPEPGGASRPESGGAPRPDPEGAVLASVVPAATAVLVPALERLVPNGVLEIGPDSELPITLDVDEPRSVGADRVVNTLAASQLFERDTLVVDLGTATTFDVVTADGVFRGGVIAPGVSAGLEWLGRRTAKLPHVELRPPETCIGRHTEACVRSGIFYSAVEGIDGVVRRILEEWDRPDPWVVATGGYAGVIGPHCRTVEHIDPFLTLRGLGLAGAHLRGGG